MSATLQYVSQAYPNQSYLRRSGISAWAGVTGAALLVLGLIIAVPLLEAYRHHDLAHSLFLGFSPVCHQLPERSFYLFGHPLAVCARCTGLYCGFAFGAITFPLIRSITSTSIPGRGLLIASAAPTAIDFLLGYFGIWENTHVSRFLTAGLLGLVSVFYVIPGIIEFCRYSPLGYFKRRKSL
jgi:uncharacterized membrane protein